MQRLLHLDIVLFAVGFMLGAILQSPAPIFAAIGAVAALVYRVRFDQVWPVAALGFFVATFAAPVGERDTTTLDELLAAGPEDFMLSGTLVDGPRAFVAGESYELRLDHLDQAPVDAVVRLSVREPTAARAGDRIRVFARCGLFAPAEFPGDRGTAARWAARGLLARCSASEPISSFAPGARPVDGVRRMLTGRRVGLERRLRSLLGRRAGVPIAMLTGTRGLVTDSEQRAHQRAGTAHLLAISGVHFGALAALVWAFAGAVLRRWPRVTRTVGSRRASAGVVLAVMLAYLLFVGAPISAVRAFVAMAAVALALVLGRRPSGLAAVATAALGLLIVSPQLIWDLGFQLSFAATAAIVLFWLRMPKSLDHDPYALIPLSRTAAIARNTARFVLMSWVATAATGPILLGSMGEVSIVAFATNVVAVPVVSLLIFPALLGGAVTMEFAPSVGEPVVWWATEAMLRLTIALEQCAALPGAVANPGAPPTWWTVAAVAAVFAIVADRCRVRTSIGSLILVAALAPLAFADPPPRWKLHFIPVGQGDATLIEAPTGEKILVDAGGSMLGRDPGRWIVVPYLRRLGIGRLDALVVTHADMDHAGGAPAVLEHIDVARLVLDPVELGVDGLRLTRWCDEGSKNDRSIVATIRAGPAVALLTGDVERQAEQAWLKAPHRAQILKVGHHGSKTSTTPEFVDAARPLVAVVSAGRHNHFGHPHPDVIRRLDEAAVRVFSTPEQGLVTVSVARDGAITTRVRRP